ncbi:hypothetical protein HanPI659440_Chr16g0643001 [Helianthus annuus]|nr:hypothetical protein HanPI659440_Chr16g0643001 [Helianthus annuus]
MFGFLGHIAPHYRCSYRAICLEWKMTALIIRVFLSSTKLILSVIKILSGLSLVKKSSSSPEISNGNHLSNGAVLADAKGLWRKQL